VCQRRFAFATLAMIFVAATFRSPWRAELTQIRLGAATQRHGDLKVAATPDARAFAKHCPPAAAGLDGAIMRHVVIIGSKGQLGTDLQPALKGFRVTGLTHKDLDVCDAARARSLFRELAPDVVINTSAFHKVDVCEDEPAASFAVNATGVYELARL